MKEGFWVREAVVLLSCPGASLDVIDACNVAALGSLVGHLVEFAILDRRCVDDAEESFL
jgi:hypothetical protein